MNPQKQTLQAKASPSLVWALLPLLVLIIPLVAMPFTEAVVWGTGDFAVAALLLISLGLGGVLMVRQRGRLSLLMILGAVIVIGAALTWIELAVGLF